MRPLEGMHVVDFGQGVAGPYGAMLLGDFGADVIKIEPLRGDWSRSMGTEVSAGEGTTYLSVNRNKRSISLDLAKPGAKRVAHRLIERADVLVESFRPGVMDRLGFGAAALAEVHPRLIYCSITGYGPTGPSAGLAAGDSTIQGVGGLMSIVGEDGGEPLRVGNVVSDMLAGMHCFEAALLGMLQRGLTGRGSRAQISLLDTMLAFQAAPLTEYLMTGTTPRRTGNAHPLLSPSGVMATADRPVVFTVLQHQWTSFCAFLGRPKLAQDPRFVTNETRMANRAALMAIVQAQFGECPSAAVIAQLREADILCAPVNGYDDLVQDPQVLHNDVFGRLAHERLGSVPSIANPIRFEPREVSATPPPGLGEQTRTILADELGFTQAEIAGLSEEGAIARA